MQTTGKWVIGNWKMNPGELAEAKKLFLGARQAAKKYPSVQVGVAAPFVFLSELRKLSVAGLVSLGAQNLFPEALGAHTGEISPLMLKGLNVTQVIIGHSERRAAGETSQEIVAKIKSALKYKLTPIICFGETERDEQGSFLAVVEAQLEEIVAEIPATRLKEVIFAYEPVWAIGSGETPAPDEVEEMRLFIHKVLAKKYSRPVASKATIIYGGSVSKNNAALLLAETEMAGFLVGGASLKVGDFEGIIAAAAKSDKKSR